MQVNLIVYMYSRKKGITNMQHPCAEGVGQISVTGKQWGEVYADRKYRKQLKVHSYYFNPNSPNSSS